MSAHVQVCLQDLRVWSHMITSEMFAEHYGGLRESKEKAEQNEGHIEN